MYALFLFGGLILVLAGVAGPLWLPSAPSSIQTNAFLKPIGTYLIDSGSKVALIGLGFIALAVFVFGKRA
jgi:hypothetical protein